MRVSAWSSRNRGLESPPAVRELTSVANAPSTRTVTSSKEENHLFVVADGMGGHAAWRGRECRCAVETIGDFFALTNSSEDITWPFEIDENLPIEANKLKTAIRLANRNISSVRDRAAPLWRHGHHDRRCHGHARAESRLRGARRRFPRLPRPRRRAVEPHDRPFLGQRAGHARSRSRRKRPAITR
jgi:hypothetical protein